MGFGDGNVVHGQLDGIANDAQGLDDVSNVQASLMHSLGSTMEGLAPTLQGAAGQAMQMVGERLHADGMQFSAMFADHSQKMHNNAAGLDNQDQDGAHVISQVANLMP